MTVKLGVAVPTCTEGLMFPAPFASVEEAVEVAILAEQLGFDSVWGNDHLTTPAYVRATYDTPPSFLDPWSYLAYVAGRTSTIGLATGVNVLPFRHPVVLAKQASTLDQLSGGRLILGVGIGAYREEFEAVWPERDVRRGPFAREAIEALRLLLSERTASYKGDWINVDAVECFPKPRQAELPVLSGGNSAGSRRRAATVATGWMPGCLLPSEVEAAMTGIRAEAAAVGRNLDGFEVALQVGVSVAPTREQAVAAFTRSQLYEHMLSLAGSTLANQQEDLVTRNLVGTPADVLEQIDRYRRAGVTTLAGLIFAAASLGEMTDAMSMFMAEVGAHVDNY